VAVAFLEGDPDRPVVLRTRSSLDGGTSDFSEFTFDDKKGEELVFLHAQKDHTVEVENDQSVTINGKETVKIDKGRTTTIAQGGDSLTVQSGDISIKASSGAIDVEALTSITLKVGQNSVKVDQTGVSINGLKVDVKGTMTTVSGDAMLTLKGGVIMVN
jgi:type VI secretion system secreted protein VgrG